MFRTHPLEVPARLSALRARVWMRVRRPEEIGEGTRWLFVVLVLASLLLTLPAPLTAANGTLRLVAVAGAVVLGLSWGAGYLWRSAPLAMDLVDAVALLAFALASPEPTIVFPLVFAALWFRSLYGSGRRAVLRCGLYAGALGASLPLWPYVPGHTGGTEIAPLVGTFPAMFLTVIVGRHLAGILRAREQAARLDAVHVSVGSQLLGVTDAVEIRQIAWAAYARVCAAMPGLRVLKVVTDGAALRVDGATGGFAGVPATLPATVLSVLGGDGGTGRQTVHRRVELDAAAGTPCSWACILLPDIHDQHGRAWLLLGSPGSVSTEAVVSVASLANQVALALRNGEVHQELTVQATLDSLTVWLTGRRSTPHCRAPSTTGPRRTRLSCSSTSTTSRTSTTPSVTERVTSCSARSQYACAGPPARGTCAHASGGTSSPSCSATPAAGQPRTSPKGSSRRSPPPRISTPGSCASVPASASPQRRARPTSSS